MHVDEFIDSRPKDDGTNYAAFCFLLFRLPAMLQNKFSKFTKEHRLFSTYDGVRYRVTGASRMGDVWLAKDHNRDVGYDLRVDLAECSDWGKEA